MKLAYILILLSAWAAGATPAPKQSGWSSSAIKFKNGPLRDLIKKGSKSKKDTIEKNLSNNETNEKEDLEMTSFVSCDSKTEETCWDDKWLKPVSCSLISKGGCPCPEGTERCDADPANGCVGYCTDVCCDWTTEYACYESWQPNTGFCATIEDGCSCPEGQTECIKGQGFCSNACCDQNLEEHCYGPNNTSYCASIAAGGCPCPEGQKRCNAELAFGYTGFCLTECCDSITEETCFEYDDGYYQPPTNQYCAAIAEGGCPCPEGQEKCGADPANNSPGYCTDVCCDQTTEETCYNPPSCALIVDGGCPCPEGQEKCEVDLANNYTGYCVDVCCDRKTEETCYTSGCQPSQFCAKIIDGGCPCLENQVRCGQDLDCNIVGWCTDICCDQYTEETCYDYHPNGTSKSYCKAMSEGGCPCPEGHTKCGADPENKVTGWCMNILTDVCCDQTTEETCYDSFPNGTYRSYCNKIADGGCPCSGWGEGWEKCGQDLTKNHSGWCINNLTDVCCDATTEETCSEIDSITGEYKNSCKAIADGGCPCWEGTERCGADDETGSIGFCSEICCDFDKQLYCYDEDWRPYCYNSTGVDDINCPGLLQGGGCNEKHNNNNGEYNNRKLAQVDNSLVSYLHHLETKYEKLSMVQSNFHVNNLHRQTLSLKQEILNLHRIIKLRVGPTKQSAVKNRGLNFWEKN